jgi:hypothetical protein
MKKSWLLSVLVVLMLSCSTLTSPVTTPTPETVSPTLSIEATNTPLMSTPTMTASVGPFSTEQAGTDERPFDIVIARMAPGPFFLLGGTKNGEWLSPEIVAPYVLEDETYQIYRMDGPGGVAKGKQPVFEEFCRMYRVETDSYPLSGPAVGVTGSWDVVPRVAEEFPTDTPTYVDELTNWLKKKGFSEPVTEISQILRVDIEGDGTDEVLISASHFVDPTGHGVEYGDYSLVLMRKVVGDSVETVPVLANYYYQEYPLQFPLIYAMTFPADLDDDGVLEILVGVERWEGLGIIVFEIDGTTVVPIFEGLCGL